MKSSGIQGKNHVACDDPKGREDDIHPRNPTKMQESKKEGIFGFIKAITPNIMIQAPEGNGGKSQRDRVENNK